VKGDQFEVIGRSKVAIHDNTRRYSRGEKPYYLLSAGDIYNMKTRQVVTDATVRHRPSTSEPAGTARPRGSDGSGAVAASIPLGLPQLAERLLMIAGVNETWWQIEIVDVDSDGDIDVLRIHLVNLIDGDTRIWEIRR
jgi:hypothetical protein